MAGVQGRFRLVPVTLLVTASLLVVKLADAGRALLLPGFTRAGVVVTAAQAESVPAPPPAATQAAAPPPDMAPPIVPPEPPEPPVSPAERQLLLDLRSRRVELDAREKVLAEREAVLDAAEHRLTGRVAEMAALQTKLEGLEKARREHDEANWAGLVKVYETMKPREAASIFNDMDMPVLVQVIDRMKEAKAAQVLGAMQPDRARLVTAQLAAQRTQSVTVPPLRPNAG
jgi:flagellar motility protein MotE (MotC chaperone)